MLFLVLVTMMSSASASDADRRDLHFASEPDARLQKLLVLGGTEGWLGSDVGTSILVAKGAGAAIAVQFFLLLRTPSLAVWLFGDTLVGNMYKGASGWMRNFTSMPRNSVGVWTTNMASVAHYWRPEGANQTGGFFNSPLQSEGNFLWVMCGAAAEQTLYLFAAEVRNTKTGLHFAIASTTLVVVEHAAREPLLWKPKYIPLRFTNAQLQFASAATISNGYLHVLGSFSVNSSLPA
jgi:hypothetical protein